jgi:hypothetical protein
MHEKQSELEKYYVDVNIPPNHSDNCQIIAAIEVLHDGTHA